MSNMKADALMDAGIEIGRQVALPDERVPEHADVEITAKRAAGYFVEAL
jgi:GTP cyclohydrolase II